MEDKQTTQAQLAEPVRNSMNYHGFSTRRIAPDTYLLSGCFHMSLYGRNFHTHASAYLVVGSVGSVLIPDRSIRAVGGR